MSAARPWWSYRRLFETGLYFRCSDAIVDIITSKTPTNARIGVPALSCNTSLAERIEACGRRLVWIDVDSDTREASRASLACALETCAVIVVHSYWGAPVATLQQIAADVSRAGRILIVDYAHRLDVDAGFREHTTSRFYTFSFSKEMPFALGGLCIPKIRPNRLSLSPRLTARCLAAWTTMAAARKGGAAAAFIERVNAKRLLNRSTAPTNVPTTGPPAIAPRPMTLVQLILLPLLRRRLERIRACRTSWMRAQRLPIRDEFEWARLFARGSALPAGGVPQDMWPQFQKYQSDQYTDNVKRIVRDNVLCRFPE